MPLGGELTVGAAIGSAALGGIKSALGFSDIAKAKKEMAALETPFYAVQPEYFQNRNIAASQAQGGLDASQLAYMTKESQRGLGSALGAIQETGGSNSNIINSILDSYTNDIGNIGLQDAQLHAQKIQQFFERNKDLAGQKTTQWAQNVLYPYENKMKLLQNKLETGKANAFGGAADFLGGVAATGQAFENKDLEKSMAGYFNSFANRYSSPTGSGNSNSTVPFSVPITPSGGTPVNLTNSDWMNNVGNLAWSNPNGNNNFTLSNGSQLNQNNLEDILNAITPNGE